MSNELDYDFLKNFIFPCLDLLLKLAIGIFFALYLFKKSSKDKIKELIIELFQEIGEELNIIRQLRYECNIQHIVNLLSPEPIEVKFIDYLKPKVKENEVSFMNDFYVAIDATGRESVNSIHRHLNRLELLLGVKEYDHFVGGLKYDLKMYLSETNTVVNTYYITIANSYLDETRKVDNSDSELLVSITKVINEHFRNYRDKLITKGEYANHVFTEACPLIEEINTTLNNHWDKRIYPHLKSLRRAIHKI